MQRRDALAGVGGIVLSVAGAGCTSSLPLSRDSFDSQSAAPSGSLEEEQANVEDLKARLDELEDELAELKTANEELAAENAELEDKLAAKRERIQELEQTIDAISEEDGDAESIQETIEAYEAEIEQLEAEVAYQRERVDADNIWAFSDAELATLQDLADQWRSSAVLIDVYSDPDTLWGNGTGWLITDRIIATNAHIVETHDGDLNADRYEIWSKAGEEYAADLVGYTFGEDAIFDSPDDIGFLRLDTSIGTADVMERGRSTDLTVGDPLLQLGHPDRLPYWTASAGPFKGDGQGANFISKVPADSGSSGSPILDLDGTVVGMTWGQALQNPRTRGADGAPQPADGEVRTTFEHADATHHNRIERIETAYDALVG